MAEERNVRILEKWRPDLNAPYLSLDRTRDDDLEQIHAVRRDVGPVSVRPKGRIKDSQHALR
jgi:hypothetical protein